MNNIVLRGYINGHSVIKAGWYERVVQCNSLNIEDIWREAAPLCNFYFEQDEKTKLWFKSLIV